MTDHELYTASKKFLTREILGEEHLERRTDLLYNECKRRDKIRVWDKALDDAMKITSSIEDTYESYPNNHTRIVNINRIDFCNSSELGKLIGFQHKDINNIIDIIDEDYFCSKVKGDSMTGIGINSNDTIIIQRTKKIDDNAVVLVALENKHFVKRINYANDGIVLASENPKYQPMFVPYGHVETFGVVRFAIRAIA